MFYQRILASRDKENVAAEIQTIEPKPEYEQIIKDPYVLEFLDLPTNGHFYNRRWLTICRGFFWSLGGGFQKYMAYPPTEEKLKRELRLDDFESLWDWLGSFRIQKMSSFQEF